MTMFIFGAMFGVAVGIVIVSLCAMGKDEKHE